jgi:hypothetical protein
MEYKSPRIVALEIDDFDIESGVDAVALVESPAIEEDFYFFSKQQFQSYTDYPKQATENAKIALRWVDENGWGSCGTPVGKARANQLAKGEPISEETIARMAAFERHRQNSQKELGDGCGRLMWLCWGGDAGIEWAQRKLRQIRGEDFVENAGGFSIGDYVSWTYGGRGEGDDRARGQIKTLRVSGKLQVPGTDFELSPTEERPAALIETRDGTMVGQYTDKLRKIQKPDNFEVGVPHYTIDGKLWEGPTHKDANGRLMTGETHTEDSEYLYHLDELIIQYLFKEEFSIQELTEQEEELVLEHLEGLGETEEELLAQGWVKIDDEQQFKISSTPNLPSIEDSGDRIYRYQYAGPVDDKNRTFCSRIMRMNKLYRKEDINQMTITGENSQFAQKGSFTYDIFAFAGGKYCRHRWIKVPFKKEDIKSQFAVQSKEKHLIAGPLMIPRKLIFRYDELLNEEFYAYFTEETIEKIAYKYLMNKYQDQTNLEHSEDIKLKDVILVESWLVEDPEKDKSYFLTGKKYPKGTWYGIMKVLNTTVWKEWIKTGRVKGFSVEGYFSDRIINAEKHKFYYRTTQGGTEIVIDHKSLVVFVLEDGERESILADGDYQLNNGKTLRVVDSKAVRGSF